MCDTSKIIDRCRRAGVVLSRDGNRIAIRPARFCPPDLLENIRRNKPALLARLEASAMDLPKDAAPWIHTARQVIAGEFDGGSRSLLESVLIGVSNVPHPQCEAAKIRLERMLKWNGRAHI